MTLDDLILEQIGVSKRKSRTRRAKAPAIPSQPSTMKTALARLDQAEHEGKDFLKLVRKTRKQLLAKTKAV